MQCGCLPVGSAGFACMKYPVAICGLTGSDLRENHYGGKKDGH